MIVVACRFCGYPVTHPPKGNGEFYCSHCKQDVMLYQTKLVEMKEMKNADIHESDFRTIPGSTD